MNRFNKKVLLVSSILLIACSLPVIIYTNKQPKFEIKKNIEHILNTRGGNKLFK